MTTEEQRRIVPTRRTEFLTQGKLRTSKNHVLKAGAESVPCIHKLSVYRGARWGHRAYSLGTFLCRPRAPTRRWFRSNRQLRDAPECVLRRTRKRMNLKRGHEFSKLNATSSCYVVARALPPAGENDCGAPASGTAAPVRDRTTAPCRRPDLHCCCRAAVTTANEPT